MKKIYLLTFLLFVAAVVQAQNRRRGPSSRPKQMGAGSLFLSKQWWIGLKAGVNLTAIPVEQRFAVIAPINYPESNNNKQYDNYSLPGSQAALEILFSYHSFSFSLQPGFRHTRFAYQNGFEWTDTETPDNRLTLTYAHEQKLGYADIPLLIRYDLTGTALRPYIQGGAFASFLVSAQKSLVVSGTDYASGGVNNFENPPVIVGVEDLFAKNYWGLSAGAGVSYFMGNVRFSFDVLYQKGMSTITSSANRYGNDRLSGIGEASDDLKMDNLSFTLGCFLPTKFLSKSFQSVDR